MGDELEIWTGRADAEIVGAVRRMFELADDPKDPDLTDWQYRTHLDGAYVAIAHDGSGPVTGGGAMYAAFPAKFRIGGRTETVIQSFDTLTLPDFRGQGLFVKLASMVYDLAAADGVAGVYGFPNGASAPGFTKRLDWTMMDPLPMLARPIGLRYGRVRVGLRTPTVIDDGAYAAAVDHLPDDLDELFASVSSGTYVGLQRDREYLAWRLARPGSSYRVHTIRDDSGRLDAFGVCELSLKHGCSLGYVMELLHRPGQSAAGRQVAGSMLRDLRRRGADLVLAWSLPGTSARSALARRGFVPLPEKVRPVELHFGARSLDPTSPSLVQRDSWWLSYLDSDTV